ncbi:MAG: tetratricopeptide repeat protein, partial [Pirellulales bacterium]|nr:tetratricopeptide repeat protein [Pirellulales bacterium]
MKRLNVKLLIIVAAAVVLFCIGIVSVHAFQTSRNVGYLLELAKESEQAGDLRQAVNFYLRFLQHRPDDTEQLANFALLYLKFAESPNAAANDLNKAYGAMYDAAQKLLSDDPAKRLTEVRGKLVDFQIRHGLYQQADPFLQQMKADNTAAGKNDPTVDLQLAKCCLRTLRIDEAAKLLEPLVGYDRATKKFDAEKALAPQEIEAYAILAYLYRERFNDAQVPNRRELADAVIEQMVKANPDNPKAILAQAQDTQPRSPEKAKPLIERALAVAPDNPDVILFAAQVAITEKDLSKAEQLLKDGVKNNPKDNRIYSLLVQITMRENRLEDAETLIREGLNKFPNDPDLLQARFGLEILRKDFVAAQNTLEVLDRAPPVLRELLECRLLLMRGEYSAARIRLEALRPKTAGNKEFQVQTDAMLMDVYRMLGMIDKVRDKADQLGENNYLQTRIVNAQSLVATGKSDEALEAYEEIASKLNPEALAKAQNVWRPLYELSIAQQLRQPTESRNWKKIDSLLKGLRDNQALPEPNLSLVDIDFLIRKGESEQAQRQLGDLAKQYPNDPTVLAAQARLVAQQKDRAGEAIAMLDKLGPELQRDPVLISTRIECIRALTKTPTEKIQQLSQLGNSAAGWSEDARFQVYSSLGVAMLQLNDIREAQRWFGKAAELRPNDSRLQWMLFDLARYANDLDDMKKAGKWFTANLGPGDSQTKMIEACALVTAVRLGVQGTIAPNQNEIFLDANQRESLKAARRILNEIKNGRPGWHEVSRLLAEVNIIEGHLDEAIDNLKEALDLGPANGSMIQQIVKLLYAKNDFAGAKEYLDKYSSLVGEELERIRYKVIEGLGESTALTTEQIDKLVDKDSTQLSDLMYRASLLASSGKQDEAETTYRKAIQL